jgi:plastocyanin
MKIRRSRLNKFVTLICFFCLLGIIPACSPSQSTSMPVTTSTSISEGQPITIEISAENMAFSRSTISVPAGADLIVVFTNKDKVPHNVAFYETKAATKPIFIGEVFTGIKTVSYHFTAPSIPGTYFFRCDIHPAAMNGDFIVTDAGS